MRGIVRMLVVSLLLSSSAAWAAPKVKGTLKGSAKSGQSTRTTGVGNETVINNAVDPQTAAGSGNAFVLTDVCVFATSSGQTFEIISEPAGSLDLRIDTGADMGRCVHFDPGFVIPEGSDVKCKFNNAGPNWNCSATGVVTRN